MLGRLLVISSCLVWACVCTRDYADVDIGAIWDDPDYDYVVVGAGSAGAVIAKELSNDYVTRVLLIEAGPYRDDDPAVSGPGNFFSVYDEAFYNFDYFSSRVKSLGNRRISTAVGRMWGGCSSHNNMVYVVGNDYDYDRWAQFGGEEWSAAKLKPIFKEMENNSMDHVQEEDVEIFLKHHGTSGRVSVRNTVPDPALFEAILGAAKEIFGMSENTDYNGEHQEGLARPLQYTQQKLSNNVVRESSSTAFLSSDIVKVVRSGDGIGVNGRKLWVHSNSFASKLIYGNAGKVVGIKYIKNGEEVNARVRNDVIVSAGAFHSPAFLMRSGIGNCTELEALGIDCVFDSPSVGKNLQDHVVLPIYGQKQGSILNYLESLTLGFYKSKYADQYTNKTISKGETIVDSQFGFFPGLIFLSDQLIYKWDVFEPVTGRLREKFGFTVGSILLRPKCTGRIRIPSKDPLAPPVIEPGYLCDPLDFEWAKNALHDLTRFIKKMQESDPSISFVYPTPDMLLPENIDDTVRSLANSLFHHSGSVRLGEVLDGNLCVKGVSGLRVADASIMPFVTTGNTNAPTMVIGKKAADLIKKTTRCR